MGVVDGGCNSGSFLALRGAQNQRADNFPESAKFVWEPAGPSPRLTLIICPSVRGQCTVPHNSDAR